MKSLLSIATVSGIGILSALSFHPSFRGKWVTPKNSIINSDTLKESAGPAKWKDIGSIEKNLLSQEFSIKDSGKIVPANANFINKKFKDSSYIIYLLDTFGHIQSYSEADDFGNIDFTVSKAGIYRIAQMNGSQILWSKRAQLVEGANYLKLPLNSYYVNSNRIFANKNRLTSVSIEKSTIKTLDRAVAVRSAVPTSKIAEMDIAYSFGDEAPTEEMAISRDIHITSPTVTSGRTKDIARPPHMEKKSIDKGKAGVMTAGVWNDLENWSRFDKTLKEEKVHAEQWNWKMDNRRYAVEVTDKNGKPAIDIALQMRNADGSIFWNAKTDNRGFAELWYAPFLPHLSDLPHDFYLYAQYGERGYTKLGKLSSDGDVRNSFRINFEIGTPTNVDICFVVDATGSMGDEINYLKEELMELMLRSSEFIPCGNIRLSTVFYRDVHDAYTTVSAPFTDRFEDAVDFVQLQSAGGGGDYPEAVDAGLIEAIEKLNWSASALSRLCFLVLDAPPHKEKKAEIERLTNEYAKKGIKIIPIAASGIDKPTEFLMKRMAAITAGDYIYITDHSGVGNSHIKPSGVKSDVDLLKNQLEKIIKKYTENKDCDKNAEPYNPDPKTLIFGDDQIIIQSYPNPATSFITIKSNASVNQIEVLSINGQMVKRVPTVNSNNYRLDVRDLSKGMYILRIYTSNRSYSSKILILNSQGID